MDPFLQRAMGRSSPGGYSPDIIQEIRARQSRGYEEAPSGLESVAGMTLAIGSLAFLGYRALKTEMGLNFFGGIGRVLGRAVGVGREAARVWGSSMAGIEHAPGPLLKDIELLPVLRRAIEAQERTTLSPTGALLRSRAASEKFAAEQSQRIRDWGFNAIKVGRFRSATISDVLAGGQLGQEVGEEATGLLRRGMELGLVSGETSLTTGYGGLFLGGRGQILDTRMFKPQNFLRGLHQVARQVRVPFTNVRPADIVASVIRPFGRGEFAGQVAPGYKIGKGMQAPKGSNWVIGGQLYSDFGRGGPLSMVEGFSGIKLGPASSKVGQAHIERYGGTQQLLGVDLRRRLRRGNQSFGQYVVDNVQAHTGVGPAYRTKEPFWKEWLLNPYIRRTQGEVVPLPNIQRKQGESFLEQLIGTLNRDPDKYLREGVPNNKSVGFFEKVRAYFNASERAAVVRRGHKLQNRSDLLVDEAAGAWASPGMRQVAAGERVTPNKFGLLPKKLPLSDYAYKGSFGETVVDIAHMMTNRLNDLAGRSFGMGFRPSVGEGVVGGSIAFAKNLTKLYGMYAGITMGAEYLGYADYVTERVTGISPKKVALSAYAAVRVGQQALRETTGLSTAMQYAEDLMPKSIDSGLSFLARTVLPPVAGLMIGGRGGLAAGAALAFGIGGTDPYQSPGDLMKEYSGEKLVPIRKSRYWMLGRQPFEGGQIDYYAPGWFARAMGDYKYTSTLYGSKDEYYSHVAAVDVPLLGSIPLPTPNNLFGLAPLLDGDFFGAGSRYLAQKHRYDRPYPDTPGVDQQQALMAATYMSSRGPYDAPLGAGERLQMGTEGTMGTPPSGGGGFGEAAGNLIDRVTELGGIHKFLWWDLPGFGQAGRPSLASSSAMSSNSRAFYDEQLGGAFGLSELYRRFVPPPGKSVNPVVNSMPTWLPGARSAFKEDRNYHIDFTLGDPYAKLKMGEFRLPGEAYERMHRLHSGASGVYDPMDRFLILADVAPHSEAFKQYKTIIDSWSKAGVLDSYWRDKYKTTTKQVKDKLAKFQFVDRRFTGLITDPDPEKTAEKYNPIEKGIGAGWEILTHDLIPRFGDTVPIIGPLVSDKLLVARSPVEQYIRNEVMGEEFADWKSPYKAFLRPKMNMMGEYDFTTSAAVGAGLGFMGANPVASVVLGGVGAVGGAILSATGGGVPQHRQNEWELQEYFDNIRYVKSLMLRDRARKMGDTELADYYGSEIKRTMAGIDYRAPTQEFISSSLKGLPRNLKSYFMPFMKMPREAQLEVLPYLPEYTQPAFAMSWTRPKGVDYDYQAMMKEKYGNTYRTSPEDRAAQYLSTNGMPSSDWAGWHPDVPMDAIKINAVDAGVNSVAADIHKFDLFPEHRFRASRFEDLTPNIGDITHVEPNEDFGSSLYEVLNEAGFKDVLIRQTVAYGEGPGVQWRGRYDNRRDYRHLYRTALR